MVERKLPPAMNLYKESCELLLELEPEEAGKVIQAAILYFFDGEVPDDLEKVEYMVFRVIRQGVDYSAETWRQRCEKNRENANQRWKKE